MKLSLSKEKIEEYVKKQLEYFYPDGYAFEGDDVSKAVEMALRRTEFCFQHISVKNYFVDGNANFNHLNSDQYATFIYFLSNSLYQISKNKNLCDKLFGLNKSLNGICIMYSTKMPDIFYLGHTVGTVIGNASFGDFLVIVNNVHIGPPTLSTEYPIVGRGCSLLVGSRLFGGVIEDFTTIGANVVLHNKRIPAYHKVYMKGTCETITIPAEEIYAQNYFNVDITKEEK